MDGRQTDDEVRLLGSYELSHVAPFALWVGLMLVLGRSFPGSAWPYTLRTVACLAVLLVLQPWRHHRSGAVGGVWLSIAVGAAVFALWVLPESGVCPPAVSNWYQRYLVLPFGRMPDTASGSRYAPDRAGWFLSAMRVLGSAGVIAIIEEYFWRGFIYRWVGGGAPGPSGKTELRVLPFLICALLFGFEHQRVVVGTVAGLAYGWLLIRTDDLRCCAIAHCCTNALLGVYVIYAGAYGFW